MSFRRTPTMLQMEANECGAAALGSILAFYGCYLPLEELRIACGVSRDGSKAVNMLKAARKYGLDAKGIQASLESLRDIPPPFIIFWEFNHFIVIDGIKNNKVYINDPATGPRTITWEALDRGFTGVLLAFEPTDRLVKSPKLPLIRGLITESLRANRSALTMILLASFFLIIPGGIIPGFNKIFIDNILIQNMQGWFYPLIVGMFIAMVLQTLLIWIQQRMLLRLKTKLILSTGAALIWHILHLPMQFFYQRYAGDIGDRVNANDRIANLLTNDLTASIIGCIAMVFFGLMLVLINVQLAGIAVLIVLLNVLSFYAVFKKIEDKTRDFLQQYGRLAGMEMSGMQMIETIKASGIEDDYFKRWSAKHAYIIGLEQAISLYNQIIVILPQLVYGLGNIAILGLGAWYIMRGQLTPGGLVAFQSLLLQWVLPLNTLLKLGGGIQAIRGDLLRMNDVFQYPSEGMNGEQKALDYQKFETGIRVDIQDLVFGYSPLTEPMIAGFNLTIPSNHRIALIGKTGSGKSTLVKLLMHLYRPWQGKITVNDISLEDIPPKEFAKAMAMVEQDIFLFEGSIRDNLSLWSSEINDDEMNQALKIAELYDELSPRGGLNHMLIEGGFNLSGGQRQRLEIARALVRKPKLLILDEATSSLDPFIEKKILENLRQLAMTIIIVTHRISAIRDCDLILIMDEGKIVHADRHQELIKVAMYQQLVDLEDLDS